MAGFDYALGGAGFESPMQAYENSLKMRQESDMRQAKADELRAKMAEQQANEAERMRFLNLQAPSINDVIKFSMTMPPAMVTALKPQFEALDIQGRQGALRFGGEVVSAINAGRPEIAVELLKQRSEAEKDPNIADAWRRTSEMVKVSPQLAFKTFAPMIAALPGGKELLENIDKAQGTARADELQPALVQKGQSDANAATSDATVKAAQAASAVPMVAAELAKKTGDAQEAMAKGKYAEKEAAQRLELGGWNIKNLKNQINVSAARLGIDRDVANATIMEKLSNVAKNSDKAQNMPADVRKSINESAVASGNSQLQAQRLDQMATDFLKSGAGSGAGAKLNEWLKKQGGYENGLTGLRNNYERVSSQIAVKQLPPGPASNADLVFALKGVPPPTAAPDAIAKFLRGMAIMERIASDSEQAKVDWMSENKGAMSKASGGFSAGGLPVKQGQSFAELQSEILKKHAQPKVEQAAPEKPMPSGWKVVR